MIKKTLYLYKQLSTPYFWVFLFGLFAFGLFYFNFKYVSQAEAVCYECAVNEYDSACGDPGYTGQSSLCPSISHTWNTTGICPACPTSDAIKYYNCPPPYVVADTATTCNTITPTSTPTPTPLPGCGAVCTVAAGCSSGTCTGTPFGNRCDCTTPAPTATPTPTATPIPTVTTAPGATAAPVATAVPAAPAASTCGPYTCCTSYSYGVCHTQSGPFYITCCAAGTTPQCNTNNTGVYCAGAPEPEACVPGSCNPSSTTPGCGSVPGGDGCGACIYTYPWDCISPWIQTTGGDVHSNTRINTPGGP